ncbi:HEAT repeat domain-containing protein [Actinomycetospora rhizophila]|uniref:HEAT repeat domain-containing protein n=1 Tax=Actinomycetospora rhizophila TaxID=1416876 RepID=A0ABV9ZFA8_9PSEU
MVLVVAVIVLAGVLIVLVAALLTGRWWQRRAAARRAARVAPVRPLLVQVAAAEPDDPATQAVLDQLAALPARTWAAVEPLVVSLVGKLRGEARGALVSVLERRGARERARRGTHRARPGERARSAHLLGVLGGADALPRLVALLADRDPEVRAVAARALGHLADPSAAAPLVRALAAPDARLPHQEALSAVARTGIASHGALLRAADDLDPRVRARAVEALGLVGAVGAAPRLVTALVEDPVAEVRLRAARALGRLGSPVALEPLLAATAGSEPAPLRATAAQALGALGARTAVPVLARLVADPDHWVAHTAAAALLAAGPDGERVLLELAGRRPAAAAEHAREALAAAGPGHTTGAR